MTTTTEPRRTLFDIGGDYLSKLNALLEEAEYTGGELTPDAVSEIDRILADLQSDEGRKLDWHINDIRRLEAEAAAADAEVEEYRRRAQVRRNMVARKKKFLKDYLAYTQRIEATTASARKIAIHVNGGVQPLTLADPLDPAAIPDDLVIVRREPDKEAIRERLAAGEELSFARLEPRGTHLRIR